MKGKNKYSFKVFKEDMDICFYNVSDENRDAFDKKWSHYEILNRVLNFMRERGFAVSKDPEVEEYYRSLSKDHRYGIKDKLEFKSERYPRGFKIDFYQSVTTEEGRGPYDGGKLKDAPYLIKLRFLNEVKYIANFLEKLGAKNETEAECKLAEDKILSFEKSNRFDADKLENFKLSDLNGLEGDKGYRERGSTYNCLDKNNKVIVNGSTKYFRDYKGRLQRGKVYHNINNMWWVIVNDTDYRNIAAFELFDWEKGLKRRIQLNGKESLYRSNKAARKVFKNKNLKYDDISRPDIKKLSELIKEEIEEAVKNNICMEDLELNDKVKTRFDNGKLKHAFMTCKSHYFDNREAISFNGDGFIGFAGWAGSGNVYPFIKAFIRWTNILSERKLRQAQTKYKVQYVSKDNLNKFEAICFGEKELEKNKNICKENQKVKDGKCFYRSYPLTGKDKIYF